MICGTEDRKGQRLQRGPCRRGEAQRDVWQGLLESAECSSELSAVSCLVCFQRVGRQDGESLPQPNPVPLILLPLGYCVCQLCPPLPEHCWASDPGQPV